MRMLKCLLAIITNHTTPSCIISRIFIIIPSVTMRTPEMFKSFFQLQQLIWRPCLYPPDTMHSLHYNVGRPVTRKIPRMINIDIRYHLETIKWRNIERPSKRDNLLVEKIFCNMNMSTSVYLVIRLRPEKSLITIVTVKWLKIFLAWKASNTNTSFITTTRKIILFALFQDQHCFRVPCR